MTQGGGVWAYTSEFAAGDYQQLTFVMRGGMIRARPHCRFARPLSRFTPDPPTYSVPLFLKRRCGRFLGMICGYVNGVRSGECSAAAMAPANRQMGTGEPLEVGGEDSYTSHPLWDLASVLYYDRALSSAAPPRIGTPRHRCCLGVPKRCSRGRHEPSVHGAQGTLISWGHITFLGPS
jgi:hypothetical protein